MKTKLLGYCSVDSGQILLTDPCYLSDWKDGEVNFDTDQYINSYDNACKLSLNKELGGGNVH